MDDPCIAVAGSKAQRDRLIAATILLWTSLGIRLAFKKAARGTEVTWIGGTLTMQRQGNKEANSTSQAGDCGGSQEQNPGTFPDKCGAQERTAVLRGQAQPHRWHC